MSQRVLSITVLVVLLSLSVAGTGSSVLAFSPATAPFERTWARTDKPVADMAVSRTWMWGPEANTGPMSEPYVESPGGQRIVQYFDKSRMEDNSYRATAPWDVTNGLLVVELMTGQVQIGDNQFQSHIPSQANVGGDANDPTGPSYTTMAMVRQAAPLPDGATIIWRLNRNGGVWNDPALAAMGVTAAHRVNVPNLNHQVASPFWAFMNSSGLVWENGQLKNTSLFESPFYATGYPVTEAYWANIKVGGVYKDVLMQCFERRCLTYTPGNPAGWQVEAGNVGQHYPAWRYGAQPTTEETVWAVAAPSGPPITKSTSSWESIPGLQKTIHMPATGPVAITISAEAGTSGGGRLHVRALVDGGAANPSDAILTAYQIVGVHSFTFVLDTVTAGTHVVEAQWLVDSGHTASMGDRSLSIAAAPSNLATGGLVTRWAHGAAISNTSNSWTPVPDMSASITTVNGANLAISVTAESFTSSSMGRMWVRARVDGQPTTPDDVVFAQGNAGGTQWRSHSMTFSAKGLSAGSHNVQIEWLGDPPYTAYMGDRTLAVHASPASASAGVLTTTSVTSSWINTGSTSWATIPNMTASIVTPAGSTVAIRLSGEVDASIGGRMFVRALVDGQPASPSDVMFVAYTDWGGTRAFTFTVTNVTAGTHTVEMQWHADAGLYATIGDRTLTIMGWPTH